MKSSRIEADFFLGANSPGGFFSYYGDLTDPQPGIRRFLIKGGPGQFVAIVGGTGTGKSSLMKRAAEACTEAEPFLERIHCSSDPDSLDGVIFHRGRASIVDATPPHVIEPGYPGGFETVVNLCDYFDEEKLERRLEEIAALQAANQECHRKCQGLLRGAELLRQENFRFAERHLHLEKIGLSRRALLKMSWARVRGLRGKTAGCSVR